MAFGRLERRPGAAPMSDINMTPLIDVMLVLLVIFIITAPLMTTSLKLDLPTRPRAPSPSDAPAFVALAIGTRTASSIVGDEPGQIRCSCSSSVRAAAGTRPQHRSAAARRPGSVPYGRVAELISPGPGRRIEHASAS